MIKRAIVLIPGMENKPRGDNLETLACNIVIQSPDRDIKIEKKDDLEISLKNSEFKKLDLFEAYWHDCIPVSRHENPYIKLVNGTKLLMFWMMSGIWKETLKSSFMALGLLLSGLFLLCWYSALFYAVFPFDYKEVLPVSFFEILEKINFFENADMSQTGSERQDNSEKSGAVIPIIVLISAFVLGLLNHLLFLSSTIRSYILNTNDTGEQMGTRTLIQTRVSAVLRKVYKRKYDEVVIIGHSFGSVIAIEMLSKWTKLDDIKSTSLVTWGSPIDIIRRRSQTTQIALEQIIQNKKLVNWLDVYSTHDLFCSYVSDHQKAFSDKASCALNFECTFAQKIIGETHKYYYSNTQSIGYLLGDLDAFNRRPQKMPKK